MFKGAEKTDAQEMSRILSVLMNNLAQFHYLTHVESGTQEIGFGVPADAAVQLQGRRLELTFILPLASPLSVREGPLTYSGNDPSYYFETLHAENKGAIRLMNAPDGCSYELIPLHRDPVQVEKTASRDRTQSAGNGLVVFFSWSGSRYNVPESGDISEAEA